MSVFIQNLDLPSSLFRFRKNHEYFVEEIRRAANTPSADVFFTVVDSFPDHFELNPRKIAATDLQWAKHLHWIFDGGGAIRYASLIDDYQVRAALNLGIRTYNDFPLILVPRLVASLRRFTASAIRSYRKRYAAACLTRGVGSRKMWDDFGDGGKGMALEFRVDNPNQKHIDSLGVSVLMSVETEEVSLFPMRYVEDLPEISDLDIFRCLIDDPSDGKLVADYTLHGSGGQSGLSIFERQFTFKSSAYGSEQEWRLQRLCRDSKSGFFSADILRLKRVIVGPNMDREVLDPVVDLCRSLDLPVDQISLAFAGNHEFVPLYTQPGRR